MSSKIFILSGPFGSGKSLTAVSFVPREWSKNEQVQRIVIDHELRSDTYCSKDGKDHPEKLLFAFDILGGGQRLTGEHFFELAKSIHEQSKEPDVIIIDDVAIFQETINDYWQDKANVQKIANLYGKGRDRCLTSSTWKSKDPGTINFFKRLLVEFMIDLKDMSIDLVITSPQHNIWQGYGESGYGKDGKPKMRILGKSAKVWDCWQQMADVIWVLNRIDRQTKKLKSIPDVSMDVFIPKAALPGIPEQFDWPGWETIWEWHKERKFLADVSKLAVPKPEFDQATIEAEIKKAKNRLVKDLEGKATLEQIKAAMSDEMAPVFSLTIEDADMDKEVYENSKAFILRWIAEK